MWVQFPLYSDIEVEFMGPSCPKNGLDPQLQIKLLSTNPITIEKQLKLLIECPLKEFPKNPKNRSSKQNFIIDCFKKRQMKVN